MPAITSRRHAIRLRAAAERHIRRGHPWVFDEALEQAPKDAQAGDLAVIFQRRNRKFLGIGLYDPHSPIRIKMLHTGAPVTIDEAWFAERIRQAHELRRPLLESNTNAYRLLFGENDGLPGLIADVYAGVLVVKVYSSIWLPYLDLLVPIMEQQAATQTTVLRFARKVQPLTELQDGTILSGTLPDSNEVIFREYGVRFLANPVRGHKTGFFLDHRQNRRRAGTLAQGKTVLDVFSYAGGFSVHALAGGAARVTSIDISQPALELAERNAALNPYSGEYETLAADAFEILTRFVATGRRFDLVIIDPPALAKRQSEIVVALKKYEELARLGGQLISPGGILMLASCSSRIKAEEFYALNQRVLGENFELLEQVGHDLDHPVSFAEGAYLKAGWYRGV